MSQRRLSNNSMQGTVLRAAADAERWAAQNQRSETVEDGQVEVAAISVSGNGQQSRAGLLGFNRHDH